MTTEASDTPPKRALIYLRVSTPGQAEDGFSLDSQLDLCRKHAESKGWALVDTITNGGVSGRSLDRNGLSKALQPAREGEIDILLSYDVDRFCRDAYEFIGVWRELRGRGVLLAFVRSEYPQTPVGQFVMQIMALVAELESDQLRDRFERGKIAKAKSGRVVGGGDCGTAVTSA
jgi:site-specific DNA recombinase